MKAKRRLLMVLVVMCGSVAHLTAEVQIDLGLNVPYYVGITTEDDDLDAALDWLFLLPDAKVAWFHAVKPVRLGGGLRLWTLVLQSVVYPTLAVEADAGPFVLNAGAGGGMFLFFGLYSGLQTAGVFVPDLSVGYRFTESFSLGAGAAFLFAPEVADLSSFGYMGTLFARYTIKPF